MEAPTTGLPFSITLKAITADEALKFPYIQPDSPLARQLSPSYVDEMNDIATGNEVLLRHYEENETTLQWGIFVTEPAMHMRLIGITGLLKLGRITPPEARIVIADPAYHNRGIAQAIYPLRSKAAREEGIDHITALIREDNDPALHVAQKMGFVATALLRMEAEHRYYAMHQLLDPEVLDDSREYALRMRSTMPPYSSHLTTIQLEQGRVATQRACALLATEPQCYEVPCF